jgi:putative SOS response-associated peptidase YedK
MCGRFAASASAEDLIEFFEVDEAAEDLPGPAYNIAPTDPIAAILERRRADGVRRLLTPLRWGLVPSWSSDARGAARLINARLETVAEKPSFRRAFAARRCLIPADGYYEWRPEPTADSKVRKQPYFIHPADGGPLAMAGVYEFWKAPDGSWLATAAIITTAATDQAGQVHDRMPVVVERAHWDAWLDPELTDGAEALVSVPVASLEVYPVSPAVNQVANDGAQLCEPLRPE